MHASTVPWVLTERGWPAERAREEIPEGESRRVDSHHPLKKKGAALSAVPFFLSGVVSLEARE
jgi:hypothetical protein